MSEHVINPEAAQSESQRIALQLVDNQLSRIHVSLVLSADAIAAALRKAFDEGFEAGAKSK